MSTEQTPEVSNMSSDQGGDDRQSGDGRVDNREFRRNRHRECYCRGRNRNCPKCQGTGQLLPNWRENLQQARNTRGPAPMGAGLADFQNPTPQPPHQSSPAVPAPQAGGYSSPVQRDNPPRDTSREVRSDRDREYNNGGGQGSQGGGSNQGYERSSGGDVRNDRGDSRGDRDRGGYGGGGGGRDSRQQRWQDKRGGRSNRNGGGSSSSSGTKGGKVCPMCGEFVPNLRAHVLARHDD